MPTFLEAVPDRVLQMSSFSKLISPGLRVGHLIVPEPLAGPLARIAEETCINASYLHQAIVYEFVQRGWLDPQIEELKATYQPLLDATLATLEAHMGDLATWHQPDGGFSVCTTLNAPVDAGVLQQKALEAGLPILIHRSACIAPCPNTGKRSNPSFIQVRTGGRSCFPRTSPQDGGDGYTVRKGVGLLTQDEKEGMR